MDGTPSFQVDDERLWASQAKDRDALVDQFGEAGLHSVGPRTGESRRTSIACEAYCGRRLFLRLADTGQIRYPISICHQDKPDFIVLEDTEIYGLEFTEAADPVDGREMARAEADEERVRLLGSHGGRGKGGFGGRQPEMMVISDIQNAINRKARKPYTYERPTDLLIYPNSNPVRVISHDDDYQFVERSVFERRHFRRIFIYWESSRIVQI